jgi:hypothetical protein
MPTLGNVGAVELLSGENSFIIDTISWGEVFPVLRSLKNAANVGWFGLGVDFSRFFLWLFLLIFSSPMTYRAKLG